MGTVTIKDIARECGVGVSTVSRAMNNHPDINPETKATIMRIISDHNYIPNNSSNEENVLIENIKSKLIGFLQNFIQTLIIKIFQ